MEKQQQDTSEYAFAEKEAATVLAKILWQAEYPERPWETTLSPERKEERIRVAAKVVPGLWAAMRDRDRVIGHKAIMTAATMERQFLGRRFVYVDDLKKYAINVLLGEKVYQ